MYVELLISCHRYKGAFCNQDVAIKVLKIENLNENIQREFAQEVHILRFVPSQFSP